MPYRTPQTAAREAAGQERSVTHRLLASATGSRHYALDRLPSLSVLLTRRICLSDYIDVLQSLRHCYRLVERQLVAYEHNSALFHQVRIVQKLAALEEDLLSLGYGPGEAGVCRKSIQVDTPGSYLGARYVLDGSSQGSVYIAAHLAKCLPEVTEPACRFWSLQRLTAHRWPAFLELLARLDQDREQQYQAVESARTVFDIFLAVFRRSCECRS